MPETEGSAEINHAVSILRAGGVLVFPTDTLYGLGADVFSPGGLERIFSIKRRRPDLALPVLVSLWDQVELVARGVPESARRLAARFWPGPLTLILPKAENLSDRVTGGRDTVAVRMPDHRAPLKLAEELGRPITGTSANRSGAKDPLSLSEVEADLGGQVDYIIRSGPAPKGTPSTIVDISGGEPRLVRSGMLDFDKILAEWG